MHDDVANEVKGSTRRSWTLSVRRNASAERRKQRPNETFYFSLEIIFSILELRTVPQTPSVYVYVWFSSSAVPKAADRGQVTFARTPLPLPDPSNSPHPAGGSSMTRGLPAACTFLFFLFFFSF